MNVQGEGRQVQQGPGADEAQKKVYNVFADFMIDVLKKI
jgi:hypothetical protein